MAALTFDDVPDAASGAASASGPLTFDDVPAAADPNAPWWQKAADNVGVAANRVASNLPFADRATAGLMAATGTGDYNTNLASVRAYNEQRQKEHPYQELAATVAGGALMPAGAVGEVARAPTLAYMAMRGGVLGSGIGAVQGASDVPDYTKASAADVKNVGTQAALGGAMGAAIPVLASGAGAAYRGIKNAFTGHVPGLSLPAQNVLTTAIANDGPERVLQGMKTLGPQGMPLDAGPSFKGIASGLANNDSALAARGNLRNTLEARNAGGDDRLTQALNSNLGPAQNPDAVIAGMQAQRGALGPGVSAAVKDAQDARTQVDTTNVLASLGQKLTDSQGNPKVVGALNKVRSLLTDQVMDPQGNPIQGLIKPVTDPLRLHNAKDALDNLVTYGDPSLNLAAGELPKSSGVVASLRGELNQALRDQVPGYADVNDRLASLHRQGEQVELGKTSVLGGGQNALHPQSYATSFGALSPEEQAANRVGLRGAIDQNLGTKGNDLSAINNLLQGPNGWNTQKLGTAFGQQPVENVVNAAGAEKTMRGNYNDIVKNSETANRQAMVTALKGVAPSAQPPTIPYFPSGGIISGLANVPAWLGNQAIGAFRRTPNDAQFYNQLGKAITTQGPEGQALVQALTKAGGNRAQNAATAERMRNLLLLGGAVTPNTVSAFDQSRQR